MFVRDFEAIKSTDLRSHMAGDEEYSEIAFLLSECDGEIASIFTGQRDVGYQEIHGISVSIEDPRCVVVIARFEDHVILGVQNAAALFGLPSA